MASKRTGDYDLVEESCLMLYNFAIPLLDDSQRIHVHKSLQKAADILEELESNTYSLRSLLHYESARCEVSNDLLTKGQSELRKAQGMDVTDDGKRALAPDAAKEAESTKVFRLRHDGEVGNGARDPGPYTRPFNYEQVQLRRR